MCPSIITIASIYCNIKIKLKHVNLLPSICLKIMGRGNISHCLSLLLNTFDIVFLNYFTFKQNTLINTSLNGLSVLVSDSGLSMLLAWMLVSQVSTSMLFCISYWMNWVLEFLFKYNDYQHNKIRAHRFSSSFDMRWRGTTFWQLRGDHKLIGR